MKKILIILDLVLTVVAVMLATQWLQGTSAPLPTAAHDSLPEMEQRSVPPVRSPLVWSPIDRDRAMLAVQENLFHPNRIYEVIEPEPPKEEEPEPENIDAEQFELVGIVQVRDRACASIIVHPKAPAAPTGRRAPARRPTPRSKDAGKSKQNRGIYVIGDDVGESGYVLAKIAMNSITLTKGEGEAATELEIPLDMADDTSKERLESANEVEQSKLQEQAAEQQRNIEESIETEPEEKQGEEKTEEKTEPENDSEAEASDKRPSPRELLKRRLERPSGVSGSRVREALRNSRNASRDNDQDEDEPPESSETPTTNSNNSSAPVPPGLP